MEDSYEVYFTIVDETGKVWDDKIENPSEAKDMLETYQEFFFQHRFSVYKVTESRITQLMKW